MKKSIKTKIIWVMSFVLLAFVAFSILVSYIFYSNAISLQYDRNDITSSSTQFFIIFTCAEIILALIIVVLAGALSEYFIAKPIRDLSNAISDATEDNNTANTGVNTIALNKQLKELNINSSDEIEELYHNIQKMQTDYTDYIAYLKEKDWDAEHDNMTMLSNKNKFERRKIEVYPFVDSIYVSVLDIINMSIVNSKLSTQAGDSIISKVARELRRISCDTIHTYRLEEDKFLVVMCGYKEEEAVIMLNRWNERVGRLNRVTDAFDCRVVWGGAFGENDFNVADVFDRAENEMYCQKMIVKNEMKSIT